MAFAPKVKIFTADMPLCMRRKSLREAILSTAEHASHPPEDGGAPPPYGRCGQVIISRTIWIIFPAHTKYAVAFLPRSFFQNAGVSVKATEQEPIFLPE